ncbi:MAG: 2,3-bisphosphoglycerate-dependent phosphoglycerate mutase [Parachlamydia sp.]|nr:2,3-bisphosphoglycerate-dependent phosphoglycerate mutase [Parachlamydia sp.]
MSKLILLRHGQSLWNKMNLFTGWVDIPLSKKGVEEALEAGRKISHVPIDLIITTTLVRAQMTAFLAMSVHETTKIPVVVHTGEGKLEEWGKIYSEETAQHTIPVIRCWELNERMYGELQGLNKAETAERFGQEQVTQWRRSYDVPPPNGESLEMTAARSIPYFKKHVIPNLQNGKNVLIVAHGNSLRSIIMQLDGLSKEEVIKLELPTGLPVFYNCQDGKITKE